MKKPAGVIDLTPSWAQAVEVCLVGLQDGTEKGKEIARAELRRMAQLLDAAQQQRETPKSDKALRLFLEFLASLPKGWLAHTSGDVGLLNEAYLAARDAGFSIPAKK